MAVRKIPFLELLSLLAGRPLIRCEHAEPPESLSARQRRAIDGLSESLTKGAALIAKADACRSVDETVEIMERVVRLRHAIERQLRSLHRKGIAVRPCRGHDVWVEGNLAGGDWSPASGPAVDLHLQHMF